MLGLPCSPINSSKPIPPFPTCYNLGTAPPPRPPRPPPQTSTRVRLTGEWGGVRPPPPPAPCRLRLAGVPPPVTHRHAFFSPTSFTRAPRPPKPPGPPDPPPNLGLGARVHALYAFLCQKVSNFLGSTPNTQMWAILVFLLVRTLGKIPIFFIRSKKQTCFFLFF